MMAEQRITLDRADYFELSALGERIQRLELQARAAAAQFAADRERLSARANALLERLGQAHGFDPTGQFRLEDAGCLLVVERLDPAKNS